MMMMMMTFITDGVMCAVVRRFQEWTARCDDQLLHTTEQETRRRRNTVHCMSSSLSLSLSLCVIVSVSVSAFPCRCYCLLQRVTIPVLLVSVVWCADDTRGRDRRV